MGGKRLTRYSSCRQYAPDGWHLVHQLIPNSVALSYGELFCGVNSASDNAV